jgi:hypothetical protein
MMKRTVFCGHGGAAVCAWANDTAAAKQIVRATSRVNMRMTLRFVMPGFMPGIHVLLAA